MINLINYDYPIEKFVSVAEKARWTMPSHPSCVKRRIYNMSTEIDETFMQGINLKKKRVLTVGSSGDQLLTYSLMGSKDVTIMDANPLTPFFVALKLEALQTLTREEFISFFTRDSFFADSDSNKNFMNYEVYLEKIRPNLDSDIASFWDAIYEKDIANKIFNLDGKMTGLPPYLSTDESYQQTRQNILNTNITFALAELSSFHEHASEEYDLIDLSNIYTYVKKDKFFEAVNNLYPFLTEKGLFKLHYGEEELKSEFNLYNKPCESITSSLGDAKQFFIWQNSPELKNDKKS